MCFQYYITQHEHVLCLDNVCLATVSGWMFGIKTFQVWFGTTFGETGESGNRNYGQSIQNYDVESTAK